MEAVLSLLLLREYGAQTCMTREGGALKGFVCCLIDNELIIISLDKTFGWHHGGHGW